MAPHPSCRFCHSSRQECLLGRKSFEIRLERNSMKFQGLGATVRAGRATQGCAATAGLCGVVKFDGVSVQFGAGNRVSDDHHAGAVAGGFVSCFKVWRKCPAVGYRREDNTKSFTRVASGPMLQTHSLVFIGSIKAGKSAQGKLCRASPPGTV